MVAESTEILAPMLQFGWATACSGVARAICSCVAPRNGPPEAVRIRRETCCAVLDLQHLEDRRVLGIDGDHRAARQLARCARGPGRRRPGSPCWPARRWRLRAPRPGSAQGPRSPRSPTSPIGRPWPPPRRRPPRPPRSRCRSRRGAARSFGSAALVLDDGQPGAPAQGLLGQQLDVAARRPARRSRPRPWPSRRGRASRRRPSRWSPGR